MSNAETPEHRQAERTPPTEWLAVDTDDLTWASWADEYVVYHRRSGMTHLLNAAAFALITEVLVEQRSTSDVALCIEPGALDEGQDVHIADVREMLRQMASIGLVRTA